MGKKRIVKKGGEGQGRRGALRLLLARLSASSTSGILFVEATYNNTKVSFADPQGKRGPLVIKRLTRLCRR
jgi:hypothetical protein